MGAACFTLSEEECVALKKLMPLLARLECIDGLSAEFEETHAAVNAFRPLYRRLIEHGASHENQHHT